MEFFSGEVEKVCDIKRNRFQAWKENGWITPSVQIAEGYGSKNIFDEYDLISILIFKKFVESGVSRKSMANLAESIHTTMRGGLWGQKKKGLKRIKDMPPHESQSFPIGLPLYHFIYFWRKDGMVVQVTFDEIPKNIEADDIIGINFKDIVETISNHPIVRDKANAERASVEQHYDEMKRSDKTD